MSYCLGYYGATDAIARKLDFDGRTPKLSERAKQGIIEALAIDYPDILSCSQRNQKALLRWVINEHDR